MTERPFALLEHNTGTDIHWDLLIAEPDREDLATWRVLSDPRLVDRSDVVALPHHRRVYLTYEGPISRDRGVVRRVAGGVLTVEPGFAGTVGGRFSVDTETWRGTWRITQTDLTREP